MNPNLAIAALIKIVTILTADANVDARKACEAILAQLESESGGSFPSGEPPIPA